MAVSQVNWQQEAALAANLLETLVSDETAMQLRYGGKVLVCSVCANYL